MATHQTITYQPALDGVRALAVIAVLCFHAEIPGFDGGYLGVSVFFTLSGFLITSLLVAEVDRTGRIDAVAFYARRARRLLPASIVCLALVVALASLTDLFDGVTALRSHVLGSLFQVANWVFLAGEGSYQQLFQEAAGPRSPLEHYWSLAIEEQFYWIWPLAFIGLSRVARTHELRLKVLGALTLASIAAAPAVAATWGPDAAYWSTPARASEILIGAFLAVVLARRSVPASASVLAPASLVALSAACVFFPTSGGPAYNGALPLVAIASGGLLVGLQAEGPVRTMLGTRLPVWLGKISYGVYLYHWPVYVIVDERRTGLDVWSLFALRLALTLAIAEVSFLLVEQPIRRATSLGLRPTLGYAAGATAMVAVATLAFLPIVDADYFAVSADEAAAAAIDPDAVDESPLAVTTKSTTTTTMTTTTTSASANTTTSPAGSTGTTPVVEAAPTTTTISSTTISSTTTVPVSTTIAPIPALARPVRIVVVGDSTAEATGAGLVSWAAANPELAQVEVVAEPGCGFLRGGQRLLAEWQDVPSRCDTWLDRTVLDRAATLQPDVVMLMTTSWDVLDHRWDGGPGQVPTDADYRERIGSDFGAISIALLDRGAARVAWIREPLPNPAWFGTGQGQEDPAYHAVLYDAMNRIEMASDRVGVVDLAEWVTDHALDDDREARIDGVHWTPETSRRIADEYLGEQLIRVALDLPRGS